MQAVEERVCDQAVLKLLRAMLRAGVMDGGRVPKPVTGTPQGGVVSPLLANIYLHRLDRAWDVRRHGVLVGYADDLVVMCKSRPQAEDALAWLRLFLAELGLEPKAAKTRIVHLQVGGEGFDFLASTTGWCLARVVSGPRVSPSSPAGPRRGRCSMPVTRSVTSRPGASCCIPSSGSWRT